MTTNARVAIGALALSAAGFVGLVQYEGYREAAYIDTVGVPTIGIGTTEGVKLGDKITVERALVRAITDISKFEGALKRCVNVPLHQYEYDVYLTFSYNVGSGAFCGSTLVRKLNAYDYAGSCAEISRWVKQPELAPRRAKERAKCEGGMQ
jgi:lysozyme